MDPKLKTTLSAVAAILAVAAAVFVGYRSMKEPDVEIVGHLEGVSKDAETGDSPTGDPSQGPAGDMSGAPVVEHKR
jgi:hypothetical protein